MCLIIFVQYSMIMAFLVFLMKLFLLLYYLCRMRTLRPMMMTLKVKMRKTIEVKIRAILAMKLKRKMMEGIRGCCKESLECRVRLLKVRSRFKLVLMGLFLSQAYCTICSEFNVKGHLRRNYTFSFLRMKTPEIQLLNLFQSPSMLTL